MISKERPAAVSRHIPNPGFYDLERLAQPSNVFGKAAERYLVPRNYNRSISFYEHTGMPLVRRVVMGTVGRVRKNDEGGTNYHLDKEKDPASAAWEFAWKGSVFNETVHGIGVLLAVPLLAFAAVDHSIFDGVVGAIAFGGNGALVGLQRYNRARMIKRVDEAFKSGDISFDPEYRHWTGIDGRAEEKYFQLENEKRASEQKTS